MSLMQTSPLSELREQVNRIFSDFGPELMLPSLVQTEQGVIPRAGFLPPIEVAETDQDVVIRAALPGIKPDDINVEIVGNTLMISGESRRETRQEEKKFHRTEFQYGRFVRRVPLPEYVQGENCQADFKNGVLELRVPVMKERKRIQIKASGK